MAKIGFSYADLAIACCAVVRGTRASCDWRILLNVYRLNAGLMALWSSCNDKTESLLMWQKLSGNRNTRVHDVSMKQDVYILQHAAADDCSFPRWVRLAFNVTNQASNNECDGSVDKEIIKAHIRMPLLRYQTGDLPCILCCWCCPGADVQWRHKPAPLLISTRIVLAGSYTRTGGTY